jgi:hypothetical protein
MGEESGLWPICQFCESRRGPSIEVGSEALRLCLACAARTRDSEDKAIGCSACGCLGAMRSIIGAKGVCVTCADLCATRLSGDLPYSCRCITCFDCEGCLFREASWREEMLLCRCCLTKCASMEVAFGRSGALVDVVGALRQSFQDKVATRAQQDELLSMVEWQRYLTIAAVGYHIDIKSLQHAVIERSVLSAIPVRHPLFGHLRSQLLRVIFDAVDKGQAVVCRGNERFRYIKRLPDLS